MNDHVLAGYRGRRPDVLALIDAPPRRVLDVGCGAGQLGRDLKARFPGVHLCGIEADPALRAEAVAHYDQLVAADLAAADALDGVAGTFDLVVAADVLEHVAEPLDVLRRLVALLSDDGRVITSLPNVRHYSTLCALAFRGRWPYRDRGIHDRTHLRFFARANVLDLLDGAGLEPLRERRNLRLVEAWSWTNPPARLLDWWPLRPFLTFQYLHLSRRKAAARPA